MFTQNKETYVEKTGPSNCLIIIFPSNKKCKTFDVYGKCNFTDCAYLHVKDGENSKVDLLEN